MSDEHINPVWKIRKGMPQQPSVSKSSTAACNCSIGLNSRSNESQALMKKVERLQREVERKNFQLDLLREESMKKEQEFQAAIREKEHWTGQVKKLVAKNVIKSKQLLMLNSQFERLLGTNKENIPSLNVVLEQETICKRRLDDQQLSEIKNQHNIEDSDLRFMNEINQLGRDESSEAWTAINLASGPSELRI